MCFSSHQMSALDGGLYFEVWGGRGQGRYQGGEAIYSEVQCTMGNGHMGLNPCEQADMTENITFPQLLWRVVNLNIEGKSY